MWQLVFACLMTVASITLAQVETAKARLTLARMEIQHTSLTIEQMATFGSAYAHANPAAAGAVGFGAAGAPAWFVAPPGAQLFVSAGTAYAVLPAANVMDVAGVLGEAREHGLLIGLSSGTQLQDGTGLIIGNLPTGIPAGSLVLVQ